MMTTEAHATPTYNSERAALYPTSPSTSDVIILGEDAVTRSIETRAQEAPEVRLEKGMQNEKFELNKWLVWNVKNDLVVQIIKSNSASTYIDISRTHSIVTSMLSQERDRHFQYHHMLENEFIPAAQLRTDMPTSFRKGTEYWSKDVDNLHMRSDIHEGMTEYIAAIERTGEDSLRSLTEEYIQQVLPTAREEALHILLAQQAEHEAQAQQHVRLIAELRHIIGGLQSQLEDRDAQLLDSSLDLHLAQKAPDIAA